MKVIFIAFFIWLFQASFGQPSQIGPGEQPQLSLDAKGIIRLVYGEGEKIFYSVSFDHGISFSKPTVIGEISGMHLGMTRGPQLASSKDYSIVTAMDRKGDIHSFRLDHQKKTWSITKNVNDVEGSAPEGLMSVTADESNNFYAVWLDAREDKNNKITFSMLTKNGSWSKNKIVYKSPDKTVCECCKPSIAIRDKNVSLMFRNWINGSRDLHLITSSDGGAKFGNVRKLGNGTWKLKGCPMDGGGLLMDDKNVIHTVWQREGVVYYDQPNQAENKIADGRSCGLFGSSTPFMTWQKDGRIYGHSLNDESEINIGEGTAVSVIQLSNKVFFAAWEHEEKILFRKLEL